MKPTAPHTDRISLTIGWLAIGVWCIAWWIIYQFNPVPGCDDIWFGLANADWMQGRTDDIDWRGAFDTIRSTYNTDNGRLSNMVMVFFMLLPGFLRALIATAFMGVFVGCAVSLTKKSAVRSALPAVFVIALLRFFVPWREQMESIDFEMNYVVPSIFIMWVYLSLLHRRDRKFMWQEAVLALLIGFWHEGFAVPFAASMAVWGLIDKRLRQRCWLLLLLTLPGMIFMWTAPAMQYKMSVRDDYPYRLSTLFRQSKLHPLAILALVSYVVATLARPWRRKLGKTEILMLGGWSAAIAASLLMQGEVPDNLRVGWVADVMGCVMTVRIAVFIADANTVRWKRIAANVMAFILLIPLTVSLAASAGVALYQHKVEKELIPLMKKSADGQVYYDVLRYWQMPPASLLSPYPEFYGGPYFEYITGIKEEAGILPTCFKSIPKTKGEKIPGDNPFYRIGGYIYAPASDFNEKDIFWNVEFGNGSRYIELKVCQFTDSEGNVCYMVWPHRCYSGIRSGIKAIYKN